MAPFLENELEHRDSVYFAMKRSGIVTRLYNAKYIRECRKDEIVWEIKDEIVIRELKTDARRIELR
jgi:hypothetical protein